MAGFGRARQDLVGLGESGEAMRDVRQWTKVVVVAGAQAAGLVTVVRLGNPPAKRRRGGKVVSGLWQVVDGQKW